MKNKIPNYIRTFHLDVVGDVTQSRWIGQFSAKAVLSHEDRFLIETEYAKLLPNDKNTDDSLKTKAASLAELSVRIIEGPDWWMSSNRGRRLVDDAPIYEMVLQCHKISQAWTEELKVNALETE